MTLKEIRNAAYNRLMNVWDYISVIWEGKDQKPSYKRTSQLIFLSLIVFIVRTDKTQTQYGFFTLLALIIAFVLMAQIINGAQLVDMFKSFVGAKKDKPETPAE